MLPGGRRVCVSVCVLSQIYPSSPFKLVQYEQEGRKQGRKQVFNWGGAFITGNDLNTPIFGLLNEKKI